jgi:hypothetical protein
LTNILDIENVLEELPFNQYAIDEKSIFNELKKILNEVRRLHTRIGQLKDKEINKKEEFFKNQIIYYLSWIPHLFFLFLIWFLIDISIKFNFF